MHTNAIPILALLSSLPRALPVCPALVETLSHPLQGNHSVIQLFQDLQRESEPQGCHVMKERGHLTAWPKVALKMD